MDFQWRCLPTARSRAACPVGPAGPAPDGRGGRGAVAVGLAAGCGGGPGDPAHSASATTSASASHTAAGAGTAATAAPSPSPSPSPSASCPATVLASMTEAQRVGQLFLVGLPDNEVAGTVAETITAHHFGSVIFGADSKGGITGARQVAGAVQALTSKPATDDVRFFVAANQEGGEVQALTGPGISEIPSALDQGSVAPRTLTSMASAWGDQLRSAGVNLNLAPVLDVVPAWHRAQQRTHRGAGPRVRQRPGHRVRARGGVPARHGQRRHRHLGQALPGAGPGDRQHRLHLVGGGHGHHRDRPLPADLPGRHQRRRAPGHGRAGHLHPHRPARAGRVLPHRHRRAAAPADALHRHDPVRRHGRGRRGRRHLPRSAGHLVRVGRRRPDHHRKPPRGRRDGRGPAGPGRRQLRVPGPGRRGRPARPDDQAGLRPVALLAVRGDWRDTR